MKLHRGDKINPAKTNTDTFLQQPDHDPLTTGYSLIAATNALGMQVFLLFCQFGSMLSRALFLHLVNTWSCSVMCWCFVSVEGWWPGGIIIIWASYGDNPVWPQHQYCDKTSPLSWHNIVPAWTLVIHSLSRVQFFMPLFFMIKVSKTYQPSLNMRIEETTIKKLSSSEDVKNCVRTMKWIKLGHWFMDWT